MGRGVTLVWEQVMVDSAGPEALGRWWAEALGWVVVNDDPEEFEIRSHADVMPVLFALGATRADVGQGDQTWVVLADPEGNEFCVLREVRPELQGVDPRDE